MCDDVAWWGRELYKYHLDDQNVPVYGARMLFGSKQKLNLYKYTLWTDLVHLTDACCFIRLAFLTHVLTLFLLNNLLH